MYPIVVQFKARREKEQLLWRSKDRLRRINVIVTDDIALRQKGGNAANDSNDSSPFDQPCPPPRQQLQEEAPSSSSMRKNTSTSPAKKKKSMKKEMSVEHSLFGDFF